MADRTADAKDAKEGSGGDTSPENDFEERHEVLHRSDEELAIAARQFTVAGVVCTKQRRLVDDSVEPPVLPSYATNSVKELLCLEYIAGFRRQFESLFPGRRPLFLHPPNEKGISKFVCTTLRPTLLPQRELYDCHALARFLAGAIEYEPLENPTSPPSCLPSPSFTLKWRAGDSFDLSMLLTSFLIGAGYDAYVVNGVAPRWICLMDQSKSPLPVLSVEEAFWKAHEAENSAVNDREPGDVAAGVTLVSRSKFTSKYVEQQQELEAKANQRDGRRAFEDYTTNEDDDDDDPLEGKRAHAWVLVRAGKRDVAEHFFLEATTGTQYSVSDAPYMAIESVWNHENYWVNMQRQPVGLTLFDLANATDWEFIFLSPSERRAAKDASADAKGGLDLGDDLNSEGGNHADGEHDGEDELVLDMPPSWVTKLHVSRAMFKTQFVTGSQRVTLFHRAKVEEFADNSHDQGLVTRITLFRDSLCTMPSEIREYFKNRKDKLECRKRFPFEGKFEEYFAAGRLPEALKTRIEWLGYRREFQFYTSARPDGLVTRHEEIQKRMTENFDGRDDFLIFRSSLLATDKDEVDSKNPYVLPGGSAGEIAIKKMKEKFARNPDVVADNDPRKRTFNIQEGFIRVHFHYATGKITAGSRTYPKTPNTPVDVIMADPSARKPKASILDDELRASIQVELL